jgi:hypothetical protein
MGEKLTIITKRPRSPLAPMQKARRQFTRKLRFRGEIDLRG